MTQALFFLPLLPDTVICGHIHQPRIEKIEKGEGSILYLYSVDWVENMTSLECLEGIWKLFRYGGNDDASLKEYLPQLEEDQYIFPEAKK